MQEKVPHCICFLNHLMTIRCYFFHFSWAHSVQHTHRLLQHLLDIKFYLLNNIKNSAVCLIVIFWNWKIHILIDITCNLLYINDTEAQYLNFDISNAKLMQTKYHTSQWGWHPLHFGIFELFKKKNYKWMS